MKKVFTLIAVTGLLSFGTVNIATAQTTDSVAVAADSVALDSIAQVEAADVGELLLARPALLVSVDLDAQRAERVDLERVVREQPG